jgi:hypothetical protein
VLAHPILQHVEQPADQGEGLRVADRLVDRGAVANVGKQDRELFAFLNDGPSLPRR